MLDLRSFSLVVGILVYLKICAPEVWVVPIATSLVSLAVVKQLSRRVEKA